MLYVTTIFYLFFGVLSGLLLNRRGRPAWVGFLLGIFMGPLGPIFAVILPPLVRACPNCREAVPIEKASCPHCGEVHPEDFGRTWMDSRGMLVLVMLGFLAAGLLGVFIFLTFAS